MKNVLLIRLSSMGDVIMATPVIRAFKRTYPDCRLTWLVEDASRDIVDDNPLLDEVIAWHKSEWKRLLREGRFITLFGRAFAFARGLRARHFDLAVDMQGLLKSAVFASLSGAERKVGLGSKEMSHLLVNEVIERKPGSARVSSQYLLLAEALGLDSGDFRMEVAVSEEHDRLPEEVGKAEGAYGRYAVFCPFTTRPQKHWLDERWGEVARRIARDYDMPVVILGGKGDLEASQHMVSLCGETALNMTGKTTIKQAAAIVKHSCLLIGVDTGLTHMGIAFDVPTIAIFGSTCPYTDTETDNALVLYNKMECSPCRRNPTCDGDYRCMKAINTEDVLGAVSTMLGRP